MKLINEKLALGTVQFGLNYGISNNAGQTNLAEAHLILRHCLNKDIKFIDTARAYGNSENVLGSFNLNAFSVCSKFIINSQFPTVKQNLIESLSALKIPAVYAYMAHDAEQLIHSPGLWSELLELQAEGKIKKIGYSLYKPNQLKMLLELGLIPEIIQVPYNIFDRRFEPFFSSLSESGCEIHTRSAFLQGLFFINNGKLDSHFEVVKPLILHLQEVYPRKEQLAAYLLCFCLQNQHINKVVFGVNTLKQLQMNLLELSGNSGFDYSYFSEVSNIPDSILMPDQWPN